MFRSEQDFWSPAGIWLAFRVPLRCLCFAFSVWSAGLAGLDHMRPFKGPNFCDWEQIIVCSDSSLMLLRFLLSKVYCDCSICSSQLFIVNF